MSILNGTLRFARLALPAALALSAVASWAAVSVSEVAVSQVGNNTVLSYRLNEPATSVSIVAGGQTYAGGTAKGLNSVNLPLNIAGSATITATAPAESGGAAGGVIVLPLTNPRDPADALNGQIAGLAVNKRAGSPYRNRIYVPYGPSQTVKRLDVFSPDGALQVTKDLTTIYTSGSWPYGIAAAQTDTLDRIVVSNRSSSKWKVLNPDLSQGAEYSQTTNVPGVQVTPNTDPSTNGTAPWNIYGSDSGKLGGTRHAIANLVDQTGFATLNVGTEAQPVNATSQWGDPTGLAIDPTNQMLFKACVSDGGTGAITTLDQGALSLTTTYISKWTSPANSTVAWSRDDAWGNNLLADLQAGLGDGTVPPTGLVVPGVALDKGFDANSPSTSKVWVAINGNYTPNGGTAGYINRLYHVRADDGHIITADTIDLQAIGAVSPATTGPMAGKAGHYLDVMADGNIAIALNTGAAPGVISAIAPKWFAIIGPNTTGPTSDVVVVPSLLPPLSATAVADHPSVGNTGSAVVDYTITCTDSAGIVADNVQVSGNLSQIGGPASVALVRGTVSADGKSAPYTTSYTVTAGAAFGGFDLPFSVTSNSKSLSVSVTQTIYHAYIPKWTKAVDGAVNSSAAANGGAAYIGTDNGKVYAIDSTSAVGAALAGFGTAGVVSVGEPVKGKIVCANGNLYVPGTNHVFILDSAKGDLLGTSPAIPNPVVAVQIAADPLPTAFVGGSDNKIHAINGITGAALGAVSADLGAAVLNIEVGPSATIAPDLCVVGCLAGDTTGKNGKIVMLKSSDLTTAFIDGGTLAPIEYIDAVGPAKSRPVFGKLLDSSNFFVVGSAGGLYSVNADTGVLNTWTPGGGGGANVGGNPYLTPAPVDATPGIAYLPSGEPHINFATTDGKLFQIFAGNGDPAGQRITFGGWPVGLTASGGFAAGSGTTSQPGSATGTTTPSRFAYMGSDATDKRFFGLNELPDDLTFTAKGEKTHIFDPNDTSTFPGYTAGAFNSAPVVSDGTVIVGSASGQVYGFPTLQDMPAYAVSVSPANSATGVATSGTVVTLVYSADINQTAVSTDTVKLVLDGVTVDTTLAQGADAKTITITPNANLTANKTYTVVAAGLTDAVGLPIQPFSSTFYTGIKIIPVVKGDVNGDGTFNAADVKEALKIAAGLQTASAKAITAGDLYKSGSKTPDGKITLEDALFLNRVLAGKDSLP